MPFIFLSTMTVIAYHNGKILADKAMIYPLYSGNYPLLEKGSKFIFNEEVGTVFAFSGKAPTEGECFYIAAAIKIYSQMTSDVDKKEVDEKVLERRVNTLMEIQSKFKEEIYIIGTDGKNVFAGTTLNQLQKLHKDKPFAYGSHALAYMMLADKGYKPEQIYNTISKRANIVTKEFNYIDINNHMVLK